MPVYGPEGEGPDGEITMAQVTRDLAAMMGNDPTLPKDRHDPEREWFFRGVRTLAFVSDVHRAVGVAEWDSVSRTYYSFMKGHGYIPAIWRGNSYPKDQWSEDEARRCHEDQITKLIKHCPDETRQGL